MEFPAALLDLCEAVHYVRTHASQWHVDENRVIVGGFSAGGHLAASLGVYWNSDLIKEFLPYDKESIRPNGLLLSYPVIVSGEFAHQGSIEYVVGSSTRFSEKDVSLQNLVTQDVPPVFMWHTFEDTCVPLENSLEFALALRKKGVPLEYHVFRRGIHGLSLATAETAGSFARGIQTECSVWPDLFASWAATL